MLELITHTLCVLKAHCGEHPLYQTSDVQN